MLGERPRRKRKLPRPPEPGFSSSLPAAPRVMALFEQMRANVGKLLRGIDRYRAGGRLRVWEGGHSQWRFVPLLPPSPLSRVLGWGQPRAPRLLPLTPPQQEERPIRQILYLGELLETCHFQSFWQALDENMELLDGIAGFEDSVRKFICHVVGITYQHIDRWLLAEMLGDL
ncbi:EIF3K factor, partial [Penelope pileata]|nr:EIF3K factor [Penelope pileata]